MRVLSAREVEARLAEGERALMASRLADARAAYHEVSAQATLDRLTLIRVAEGLYRARDFRAALEAFRRVGTLRSGEEPYRYYIAVALYETGSYAAARRELDAALPYIEVTPDVARYQAKIEGALR
ncbi:MAG TPA: tetratricopeptide repeat protein [Thermoanaerobaculia bacterium]